MTPDEIESALARMRPAPPDPALRGRVLAAARARWTTRLAWPWHWRLATAALVLVALDAAITARIAAGTRALSPPLPPATIAVGAPRRAADPTPTLLAINRVAQAEERP